MEFATGCIAKLTHWPFNSTPNHISSIQFIEAKKSYFPNDCMMILAVIPLRKRSIFPYRKLTYPSRENASKTNRYLAGRWYPDFRRFL